MSLNADQLLHDETFLHLGRRILAGHCALFVGAGASISSGAPTSDELAALICAKVLMTEERFDLPDAVAYADAMSSRRAVVEVIKERLAGLEPSDALRQIVRFRWKAIFSVNFDDLVEKAYKASPEAAQQLEVFVAPDNLDKVRPNRIPFYMLHGSYKDALDKAMGLTLTTDDMLRASPQRRALYRRLTDHLQEDAILYAGFALGDLDFQTVITSVWESVDNQSQLVPRGYALHPDFKIFAARRWDEKKITLIDATLESFLEALTRLASGKEAEQAIPVGSAPIVPPFLKKLTSDPDLAEEIRASFEFPELAHHDTSDAHLFFTGGPPTWAIVRDKIDAARDVTDQFIEQLLVDPAKEPATPSRRSTRISLITGPAGTGKSTLLHRVAYDLANTWNKPVVWARDPSSAHFDLLELIAQHADERLYVFVDNCADAADQVTYVISRCRSRRMRVSFVLADRRNEWQERTRAHPLEPDDQYALGRISETEARGIIEQLRKTEQLGTLAELSAEEQLDRLMERAGRQLLVALREVTEEGRRFDEIVLDEYTNIPSELARRAYLAICTLFQFGILTRAGILSRAIGVPLGDFSDQVLHPTVGVILERQTDPRDEPRYQARHEVISAIVFRRALATTKQRQEQILATLHQLDLGYRDDHRAFTRLINHRFLSNLRLDATQLAEIYSAARKLRPTDAFVVQQQALSVRQGDPAMSRRLIREATEIEPNNDMIKHSRAVLMEDDAWREDEQSERQRKLNEAATEYQKLIKLDRTNSASYVSLARLFLKQAREAETDTAKIEELTRAQRVVRDAFVACPSTTSHMLQVAADVDEAAGELVAARESYQAAVEHARANADLWINYSQFLLRHGDAVGAVGALNAGIDVHPADPSLNYHLARALEIAEPTNDTAIRRAYEYAVAEPVRGFEPQFYYAVYLFTTGDQEGAMAHFRELRGLALPYNLKALARKWITDAGGRKTFTGTMRSIGVTSAMVEIIGFDDPVFISPSELRDVNVQLGASVAVSVYFNLFGPRAVLSSARTSPAEVTSGVE